LDQPGGLVEVRRLDFNRLRDARYRARQKTRDALPPPQRHPSWPKIDLFLPAYSAILFAKRQLVKGIKP
jgi:hypothetical protein